MYPSFMQNCSISLASGAASDEPCWPPSMTRAIAMICPESSFANPANHASSMPCVEPVLP